MTSSACRRLLSLAVPLVALVGVAFSPKPMPGQRSKPGKGHAGLFPGG